ncbi:hypothetical protein RCC89_19710 [Cytophagaceae bacterium ABcell3]|nr:hypothetical protein RCC89_19710 [Cytophagaceae bacterium ABcell3]
MLTEQNILSLFESHGVPQKGIPLDFLPSDQLVLKLTLRFKIEFAVMFTIGQFNYYLYSGNQNSVNLPISSNEILLKHTHPRGTPFPSPDDINWLITAQSFGLPQVQSVILPIGKNRVTFRSTTPTS